MTALQAGLDAIDAAGGDELIAAKVKGLLIGYDARWRDVPWESLSVEEVFQLPIINPETGAKSRTFMQAGKFDGTMRYLPSGKVYLREAKTTTEDIADPNSTFWRRWKIAGQGSHYALAKWQGGEKVDGIVVDVVKKPGIRPKAVEGPEGRNLVQNGTYFGFPVEDKRRRILRREDAELYTLRLARDCLSNPEKYFQRRTVPRLDAEIVGYAQEVWDIAQAILETRRTGRSYRNPSACMQFNSACEYLGVCCGEETLESDRWERTEKVHEELDGLEGDDRNVLTHSRLCCYQLCKKKHEYRYEIGIRRRDEDEREALVLGTLWHLALEHWWSFFSVKEPNHVNGNEVNAISRPGDDAGLERSNLDEGAVAPF